MIIGDYIYQYYNLFHNNSNTFDVQFRYYVQNVSNVLNVRNVSNVLNVSNAINVPNVPNVQNDYVLIFLERNHNLCIPYTIV